MPLPEENSSPDWMLLLTMHLHCHESEPKGASNPEQSHCSTLTTLPFAVSTQKLQSQLPWGGKELKQKKQKVPRLNNKLLPALAVPAKQNHTVQEVHAFLGIWHSAR